MATRFRSDIQGLRAIAVLTVVAAHAGVPFLPGGFVGVDVFFVVSGFLISGLLFAEASERGRPSLSQFWARRARRILPAATVVTLVTVVVSLQVMSLIDARQVLLDAGWATAFGANIHFAQQDIYYFAQAGGASPLQHYWSLAVEEQFYLLWPVLVVGVVALAHRLRRGRPGATGLPRRPLLALLLVISIASFAWSIVQTANEPGSAYFSTLTRSWELGVGALVALITPAAAKRLSRRVASAMAVVGLLAITVAVLTYTPETEFPGWAAALPVFGTALLLAAGLSPAKPVTEPLLAARPMQAVGAWSYSLYLWHWPALILAERFAVRPLEPWETALVLTVALALSVLTYRYIEGPFRSAGPERRLIVRKPLALYPASLALVGLVCVGAWQWTDYRSAERGNNPAITVAGDSALTDGADSEQDPEDDHTEAVELVRASVDAAREDIAVPSDLTPDLLDLRDSIADVGECDYTDDDIRVLCERGDPDGDRTLVVIGDSHARAWIPAFDRISEGWRIYYLVKSQCTAAQVTVAPLKEAQPFEGCDDFHDWVAEQVAVLEPDLTVVASSPPVNGVYDGNERYESVQRVAPLLAQGYDDLFADLLAASRRVVLLRDVPKSSDDPGTCLTQGKPSLRTCMFVPVERSEVLADVAVQSARLAGAEVVDPLPWLCYDGDCPVVIGGTLSYRDTDHLTTEYAASLAGALGRALRMTGS